jgi:hypothetical protein
MKIHELIERVRKIDAEAAEYLERDAPQTAYYACYGPDDDRVTLENVMLWNSTPQGREYWSEINNKLNKALK